MPQFKSLVGSQFGKLTVVARAENRGRHVYYLCQCECGKQREIRNDKLTNGQAVSCGCQRKTRSDCVYHSKSSKLYHVYIAMKQRCFNPKSRAYKNYGARGITVCSEWLGKAGYENFRKWAIEAGYHDGAAFGELTLDRKDVDGNYEPDNCRWISVQAQQNNTTRNVILECGGEAHTLKEWSEITGIKYSKIAKRNRCGWPVEKILELEERGKIESDK